MTNEEYLDYWLLPPWGKQIVSFHMTCVSHEVLHFIFTFLFYFWKVDVKVFIFLPVIYLQQRLFLDVNLPFLKSVPRYSIRRKTLKICNSILSWPIGKIIIRWGYWLFDKISWLPSRDLQNYSWWVWLY